MRASDPAAQDAAREAKADATTSPTIGEEGDGPQVRAATQKRSARSAAGLATTSRRLDAFEGLERLGGRRLEVRFKRLRTESTMQRRARGLGGYVRLPLLYLA